VEVEERLNAESVACKGQTSLTFIEDRDGEHARQPRHKRGGIILIEMEGRLAIGASRQLMSTSESVPLQLAEIIDLAVITKPAPAGLIQDRLVPAGQVDDRESPMTEEGLAV